MNRIVSMQISNIPYTFPSSIKCSATKPETGLYNTSCMRDRSLRNIFSDFCLFKLEEYISLAKPRGVFSVASRIRAKVK